MQQEQREPSPSLDRALAELRGSVLSSFEFVQDYLQLRFDGPCLSLFTHPIVYRDGKQVEWTHFGFADLFRPWIGCPLVNTAVTDDHILLLFADGGRLTVSLRDEDYQGPEALMFQSDDKQTWVV